MELSQEGLFGFLEKVELPLLSPTIGQVAPVQCQSPLSCTPWEQGVNFLQLMPCSPFPAHVTISPGDRTIPSVVTLKSGG